jgi:large subunit ribosomal protein L24
MAQRIKSGDLVKVISGADKGKTGKVLRVITAEDRVIVEGINRVWKHVKPKAQGQQGSKIQKNAPIHISNVMPIDPNTGKATRVKFEVRDGVKHRVAVKSGASLGSTRKAPKPALSK